MPVIPSPFESTVWGTASDIARDVPPLTSGYAFDSGLRGAGGPGEGGEGDDEDVRRAAEAFAYADVESVQEIVKVELEGEKEGWLLKHSMYLISSQKRSTSTRRRYSDFQTLLSLLVLRYPFRLIPPIPPKSAPLPNPLAAVSNSVPLPIISGTPLISTSSLSPALAAIPLPTSSSSNSTNSTTTTGQDAGFLSRRRAALQRFLTSLVAHPILSLDPLVLAFLAEPSDWSTYLKSHPTLTTSIGEEPLTPLPPTFLQAPPDVEDRLYRLREALPKLVEAW